MNFIYNLFSKNGKSKQKETKVDVFNSQVIYIFSLGNPGKEYEKTRHNAGRIVCDEMKKLDFFKKIEEELNRANQNSEIKYVTIKYFEPDTYMNESGKHIREKFLYNKDESKKFIKKLVIIYDDIDLPMGEVKLSYGRSSGGHNGVESVIRELGHRDFYRVRIGIGGKPYKEMLLQDYVLSKFKEEEVEVLKSLIGKVEEKIDELVKR